MGLASGASLCQLTTTTERNHFLPENLRNEHNSETTWIMYLLAFFYANWACVVKRLFHPSDPTDAGMSVEGGGREQNLNYFTETVRNH